MLNFTFKLKYKRKTRKEKKIKNKKLKKRENLYGSPLNFYLALNYW